MGRAWLFLLFALPAAAAESSSLGGGSSITGSVFRMLGSLALVIAVFFGAAWLFKNGIRFRNLPASQRKLQVLEARSLGPRQAVYVVGYENQRLLIGSTAAGLALLTHLPDGTAPDPAAQRIVPVRFGEVLMNALGRKQ
jgi:flagellar biosynthetic protein FliO